MKTPVVFIIFKRIDTTKKVFRLIHYYKPNTCSYLKTINLKNNITSENKIF